MLGLNPYTRMLSSTKERKKDKSKRSKAMASNLLAIATRSKDAIRGYWPYY